MSESAFPEIWTRFYEDGDPLPSGRVYSEGGMTLRDYFPAKALQGHCSQNILAQAMDERECELAFVNAAPFSYRMADAMLKAREQ